MKRKNVFILVISMVIFLGFANNVAAQIYRMDDSVYENMEYENLNLGFSKLDSYDINNNNITPVNDVGDLPLAFIIDYNNRNAVTYEANANDEKPYLLKLSYKNITSIGSRNVDVNIYITKIALSDYWGNGGYYSEDGATFAFVSEDAVWIGSEISSVPYRYSAHQEVEVTTEILWSDDHTVVDLPFLNIQSDIDINYNTLKNKTKEMWKAAEGYIGDFYIFNSSQLAQDENGAWYNTGDSTNGTDSYIKTGIYAPTENGRF